MGGIGQLRTAVDGPVIAPTDGGFDGARRVWNAHIDRRPQVIARYASTADVAAAIGFACRHRLEVSVRGGAHGSAGTALCDGGLMIALSLLNAVTVDATARRAQAGGGALLAAEHAWVRGFWQALRRTLSTARTTISTARRSTPAKECAEATALPCTSGSRPGPDRGGHPRGVTRWLTNRT